MGNGVNPASFSHRADVALRGRSAWLGRTIRSGQARPSCVRTCEHGIPRRASSRVENLQVATCRNSARTIPHQIEEVVKTTCRNNVHRDIAGEWPESRTMDTADLAKDFCESTIAEIEPISGLPVILQDRQTCATCREFATGKTRVT